MDCAASTISNIAELSSMRKVEPFLPRGVPRSWPCSRPRAGEAGRPVPRSKPFEPSNRCQSPEPASLEVLGRSPQHRYGATGLDVDPIGTGIVGSESARSEFHYGTQEDFSEEFVRPHAELEGGTAGHRCLCSGEQGAE